MIVIDASAVGPIVLLDERLPSAEMVAALATGPLTAPAHWPTETANMLLVAYRRRRLDDRMWVTAFTGVGDLGVEVAEPLDPRTAQAVARLAAEESLTVYDAAYLHLAITRSAVLATLDDELIAAAARRSVPVLPYR